MLCAPPPGVFNFDISFLFLVKLFIIVSLIFEQDRTALLFLLFPAILLVLRSWIWKGCMPAFPVQLYQVHAHRPSCCQIMSQIIYHPCFALSGVAFVPLHWFSFARKHLESKWERYSFMVMTLAPSIPCSFVVYSSFSVFLVSLTD